ncbi:DUF1376 domain-containing protein [Hymenobacter koreensis]|uniref:DUF1376 domain-containing protein n=1 Tax=Hymenobacter koreensis TaxID=1084523 RepID=A0ABP8JMX2_9BACT
MKAYSFYFNASDWLASSAVKLMSKAERGVYIQLLALAWGMERPGTLPAVADKVRRLAEMSLEEWAESGETILEKFPLSECGTYRYNPRLVAEASKEQARSEKAAASANKRWQNKPDANAMPAQSERNANASNPNANASQNACDGNAIVKESKENNTSLAGPAAPAPAEVALPLVEEPKPTKSKPKTDQVAAAHPELAFAALWDQYHNGPGIEKRGSKATAQARWEALPESTRRHILAGLDAYRVDCTRNGPEFMPYCEKFLNLKKQVWATEGYGRTARVIQLAPEARPVQTSKEDLWGFNDARTHEPRPAYASSGQFNGTTPR